MPVLALESFAPDRGYVVEVSSYQIDLAPTLAPSAGILINLSGIISTVTARWSTTPR